MIEMEEEDGDRMKLDIEKLEQQAREAMALKLAVTPGDCRKPGNLEYTVAAVAFVTDHAQAVLDLAARVRTLEATRGQDPDVSHFEDLCRAMLAFPREEGEEANPAEILATVGLRVATCCRELETFQQEISFTTQRIVEHIREFTNAEKHCQFCGMDWDTYVSEEFPHLKHCPLSDMERLLRGKHLEEAEYV